MSTPMQVNVNGNMEFDKRVHHRNADNILVKVTPYTFHVSAKNGKLYESPKSSGNLYEESGIPWGTMTRTVIKDSKTGKTLGVRKSYHSGKEHKEILPAQTIEELRVAHDFAQETRIKTLEEQINALKNDADSKEGAPDPVQASKDALAKEKLAIIEEKVKNEPVAVASQVAPQGRNNSGKRSTRFNSDNKN